MNHSSIVERVQRYLIHLPDTGLADLSISMLAEHFAVSRCHISRSFHRELGMTLAAFIQQRKLRLAERFLMREPSLTVKGLAARMGYIDYPYFILLFRGHWGQSPGRYRKLAGKEILRVNGNDPPCPVTRSRPGTIDHDS